MSPSLVKADLCLGGEIKGLLQSTVGHKEKALRDGGQPKDEYIQRFGEGWKSYFQRTGDVWMEDATETKTTTETKTERVTVVYIIRQPEDLSQNLPDSEDR